MQIFKPGDFVRRYRSHFDPWWNDHVPEPHRKAWFEVVTSDQVRTAIILPDKTITVSTSKMFLVSKKFQEHRQRLINA